MFMIFKLFFKLSSMASMADHSPKPKKPLSLLFLLLPTSFTFAFLLIAFINGTLSFFSLPSSSINELKPISSSPLNMSIPIFMISKRRSSMNKNPTKKMIINSNLKFLQPNKQSMHFSTRVSKFINSSCNLLFFMTWISSSSLSTNFGPRELLSMESVFKFHPNACLLIVSNSMDTSKGARILKPYKDQGFKVSAISPDNSYFSTFLFSQTPAESWFKKLIQGSIDPGEVSLGQNMSNLIRLAILYKFGGVYLDTDVLLMKSLHGLGNVIGAQTLDVHGNWSRLNNAVMIFSKGHPLVLKFMEEFVGTFDGRKWGHNGPYLVSRVVERVAGKPGFEFSVLPPAAFYPVGWRRINGLFERPLDGRHARWVKMKVDRIRKESFALHLWNRESREFKVGDGSVIQRLIKLLQAISSEYYKF